MFVDEITIEVCAGKGGDGAATFRREMYVPRGGPNGGDGGRGGDVVLVADGALNTLSHLRYQRRVTAKNGVPGKKNKMHGKRGDHRRLPVPLGTLIYDAESGEQLADIQREGEEIVVAKGGRGGRGNVRFATAENRTPRMAERGRRGEERRIRLELKLLADVGLLGFPSVGKSTLIRRISNARPQVGAYHFTTLRPHLGVVDIGDFESIVVADLPGLIVGASEGKGLGQTFLRHLERTRLMVHLIEVTPEIEGAASGRDPIGDFDKLVAELNAFDAELAKRQQLVVLTKAELDFVAAEAPRLESYFRGLGYDFIAVSAVTGEGLGALVAYLADAVRASKRSEGR